MNIRFSFVSVYLASCLISPSLIHLLPILINYIRLKFQTTVSGSFWGKKITFKVVISNQEFLTGCSEFWGVKGASNLRWSDLLAFWRSEALLSSTGLERFRNQARTGCSCVWFQSRDCIFPLQDEHLLYPRDCLTFSDWSGKQKWTQPVRRRSVCAPFLQSKQPCSPSKYLRWFVKHLNSIKVVVL